MFVIAKRSLAFNPSADLKDKGVKTYVLRAAQTPQQVPDWVGDTKEFKLAESDGTILEVGTPTKRKAAAPKNAPIVGQEPGLTATDSPTPEEQANKVIQTAGLGMADEAQSDGTETIPENGNSLGIGSMVGVVDKEASAAVAANRQTQQHKSQGGNQHVGKPNQQRQGGGR